MRSMWNDALLLPTSTNSMWMKVILIFQLAKASSEIQNVVVFMVLLVISVVNFIYGINYFWYKLIIIIVFVFLFIHP